MVRGGSWNNDQDNARAAYRNHNHPGNRNNNLGFRLLCLAHIFAPLQGRGTFGSRCGPGAGNSRPGPPELAVDQGLRPEAKGR